MPGTVPAAPPAGGTTARHVWYADGQCWVLSQSLRRWVQINEGRLVPQIHQEQCIPQGGAMQPISCSATCYLKALRMRVLRRGEHSAWKSAAGDGITGIPIVPVHTIQARE
jgi:hypothetical protein